MSELNFFFFDENFVFLCGLLARCEDKCWLVPYRTLFGFIFKHSFRKGPFYSTEVLRRQVGGRIVGCGLRPLFA